MEGSWLWWVIIGAIAGALAKWIMPGRDPGGIIITILLGIVGGVLGGWLANNVLGLGVGGNFIVPIIVATLGAVIVLVIYRAVTGRRAV